MNHFISFMVVHHPPSIASLSFFWHFDAPDMFFFFFSWFFWFFLYRQSPVFFFPKNHLILCCWSLSLISFIFEQRGGAVYILEGSGTFTTCSFVGNTATEVRLYLKTLFSNQNHLLFATFIFFVMSFIINLLWRFLCLYLSLLRSDIFYSLLFFSIIFTSPCKYLFIYSFHISCIYKSFWFISSTLFDLQTEWWWGVHQSRWFWHIY